MQHKIHPTAVISSGARISDSAEVGPYCVIYEGVILGDHTKIAEYCSLGGGPLQGKEPLSIGPNSVIRSHSVIYAGSCFEDRLETGHHVMIREKTTVGKNLRVGNFSDIEGHCEIGDYCRFHGYTHVGKGSKIGNFVWLFSLTTATNDPLPPSLSPLPVTIEDGCVVCVGVTLMPGTTLQLGCFISAGSTASGTIPPGAVVSGPNSEIVNHVCNLISPQSGLRHPWMRHYASAYPAEAHPAIAELLKRVSENRFSLKVSNE